MKGCELDLSTALLSVHSSSSGYAYVHHIVCVLANNALRTVSFWPTSGQAAKHRRFPAPAWYCVRHVRPMGTHTPQSSGKPQSGWPSRQSSEWIPSRQVWNHVQEAQHQNQLKAAGEQKPKKSVGVCVRCFAGHVNDFVRSTWDVLKEDPKIGISTIICFLALLSLGVCIVYAMSTSLINNAKDEAYFTMRGATSLLQESLQKAVFPNSGVAMHVVQDVNVYDLLGPNNTDMDALSKIVYQYVPDSDVTWSIMPAPAGIVSAAYPLEGTYWGGWSPWLGPSWAMVCDASFDTPLTPLCAPVAHMK